MLTNIIYYHVSTGWGYSWPKSYLVNGI
jgi:hypothetical protein